MIKWKDFETSEEFERWQKTQLQGKLKLISMTVVESGTTNTKNGTKKEWVLRVIYEE